MTKRWLVQALLSNIFYKEVISYVSTKGNKSQYLYLRTIQVKTNTGLRFGEELSFITL